MIIQQDYTVYSAVVKLIATRSGYIPANQGRLAQAAFLDIIRSVDPELSAALHVENKRRPYTVSPLQGLGRIHGEQVRIRQGQEVWLRFTLLGNDLFATFVRFLLHSDGTKATFKKSLRLGELDFVLTEFLTTPSSHRWAGYTTLYELHKYWYGSPLTKSSQKIEINFNSPTVFSRSNDKNGMGKFMETFPSPSMFFGSLAAVWNAFMPAPLDKQAIRDYAEGTVVVGLYKMESRFHHYWGKPQIGAAGYVNYQLKDKQNEEMVRTLNMLADFAFYSGVGAKTTMGMGMVRRVKAYRQKGITNER